MTRFFNSGQTLGFSLLLAGLVTSMIQKLSPLL